MTTTASDAQGEMLSLVTARVRDVYLRKPFYIDGSTDLVAVCRALAAHGQTHALVQDGHGETARLGIFTTTDLRDALLRAEPPQALAVREVARFELIEVQADAELFEALWLMVRHRVHRLLVREGSAVLGMLGQLDLVSFVANHSHIIALQIDEAASPADLRAAAQRIDVMVRLLHDSGALVTRTARLVGELNARIFARLWSMLAPPELVANSCLLVMGSEGRGEQILKTDQDNALLLRDGFECAELERVAHDFNAALAELGYPRCPGDIMLTNPLWRQPLASFRQTMRSWVYGSGLGGDAEGAMRLAIFFDASAVAGDASLLQDARTYLDTILAGNDAFLARFAAAADQFHEPGGWFTRMLARRDEQMLDLKKLGTFPIVHGVRALSLQYGVREPGTAARLQRLAAQGHLPAPMAEELTHALHALMQLRLTHQLQQRARGELPDNEVLLSALAPRDREPLRDALAVVKTFRQWLRHHYRLDAL